MFSSWWLDWLLHQNLLLLLLISFLVCLLQLTSAIVMNIFSACFSAFGSIILCIACFSYVAEMEDYVWSQVGTKFNNYCIKILDITEKNYDEWCMFAMNKVWKRQPKLSNIFGREILKKKKAFISSKFLSWKYFKISFPLVFVNSRNLRKRGTSGATRAGRGKEESSPRGGFGRNSVRPIHSFWTFTFQSCEKIYFSCVKPLNCGTSLQQP